ncbi:iron complex outermembrane receptor protein [Polymorphobacter multimanifer]|uniref:Iron complex outermembrane receptor protein n=2 Tax=Polymorphobacter multimanifer TaxID=1070431 RepID=A0A841LFY2_9SPHN|nr:TonB-dependent receptor [Polymorphobacter multimanifer]MBB6228092.1 iron complex outermembrane receptor protein [Polymorphobacter multimanifer]
MQTYRITVAALLLAGIATPLLAQQATTAQSDTPAAAEDDAAIIVTAERRDQNIQDVTGVVQSLSAAQLRADGIADLRQLQVAIPGLSIANQEGNIEIFIRGVGSANNTELGDPAAAPHLNGIYIPRPRGLGSMFYDLERVEVNKGPQGTLYGRNALAGTINIITARPRLGETSGYVQGEVANRSSYGFEGALNLPLGATAAVRASGFYANKDFGFRNAATGAQARTLDPAGLEENYGGRLSLLWEPTSALSVSIVGDYGKETGTGYPGANIFPAVIATGLRPDQLDLRDVVYRGQQGVLDNTNWGVQGKLRYDFGSVSAEFNASYRDVDFFQANASSESINWPGRDLDAIQYDNFSNNFWETRSQSQIYELRLFADEESSLRWTLGGFYFKEEQQVGFLSLADRGFCCYSGTEFVMPEVEGKSYAFFADTTYDVSDRLRLFGGMRYTDETKSRYGIGGNLALTLGGENFDCCIATRFGTEGFRPNLLDRPNFDLSNVQTPQQVAQFLIESTKTPGVRDTLIQQIQTIANGTNPNGTCFTRPDIDNGFVTCPVNNPSDRNGGFSYANLGIPTQQVGSAAFNYFDFRLGADFDLSDDSKVYAKVSTGHKAGGFNDSFNGSTIPEAFNPEKVVVYEIGSRNVFELDGRRSVFNLTGFWYDYSDQVFQDLTCINLDQTQVPPVCNGYSLVNRNIGSSRIRGFELETRFSLPARIGLDFNLTYLDTKVTSGIVADARGQDFGAGGNSPLIDLSGNRLPLASRWNVNARIQQAIGLGSGTFDWQALVNYRSAFFLSQFNERDVVFLDGTRQTSLEVGFPDEQKAFATVNIAAGYTIDNYRIEAWASNLFDVQASQKALVGSSLNIRFLNDARTFGLRGRVTF